MVLFGAEHGAAREAARIAVLLQERNLGGRGEDLAGRLQRWNADRSPKSEASRKLAERWAERARGLVNGGKQGAGVPHAILLAAGMPDNIARRRDSSGEHWLAAGGRGFVLDPASPLARQDWLAIGDAQGQARGARITAALPLAEPDLERWLPERIERRQALDWNKSEARVEARVERRVGAITLATGSDPAPDMAAIADILVEKAVEKLGELLPPALLARARHAGIAVLSPENLAQSADQWLAPLLAGRRDLDASQAKLAEAALALLDWDSRQRLDRLAPRSFTSPAGTTHAIDYAGDDAPSTEVRVQALFGLERHPVIGDTPLLLKLTSPAGRPLQATRDLPGFWRGSWAEVRKEMKGRYPKHRWPEEPWAEAPSLKTKNAFSKAPR
jgi:ATP-dependent helicase HrpB